MAKKRNPKKSKVQQSSNINEVNKQIDVQNTETDENINKNNAVNTEAVTAQNTPVISRQKEAAAPLKGKEGSAASSEQIKGIALSVLKVLLPVAACAIVIAFIISIVS